MTRPGLRSRATAIVVLALGAGLTSGCSRRPAALAVVAGHELTAADLADAVTQQTGRAPEDASPELTAAVFEARLEEEVLLAASANPADRSLPASERSGRARELIVSLCPPPAAPRDDQVAERVARLTSGIQAGERIRLRQLILPDRAAADKARERARSGADFAELSREVSRAPNAEHGGALGWIERGQLPPEFEAATFDLQPGEISVPVASNAGWHLFQVTDRRAAGEDADTLMARARSELAVEAAETTRRDCLRSLAGQVGVVVNCDTARFPCRNPFEVTP